MLRSSRFTYLLIETAPYRRVDIYMRAGQLVNVIVGQLVTVKKQ